MTGTSSHPPIPQRKGAPFVPFRQLPQNVPYKPGDVMVVFGELFQRGYANGIVDEAEKAGLQIIRSTVGRRDSDDNLRALTPEESALIKAPFINVPLEAGFDLEKAPSGKTPCDQLHGVKMGDWDKVKLNWDEIFLSQKSGVLRFQNSVQKFMSELEKMIPKGANVLFVHTMAGGVPRAKIMMPTMNKIFKGRGDRFTESKVFADCDLGRLSTLNFDEVTANTFKHLLDHSGALRGRIERDGGNVSYVAYGYHGTEVLIEGEYRWQTYSPYFQGSAKMLLEEHALDAAKRGLNVCVYNCPEILTNSSSVFQGVEVSLYPFLGALMREGREVGPIQGLLKRCAERLKAEHTLEELLKFTDQYLTSNLVREYNHFDKWWQHNGKEQMEFMLSSSDHLIDLHRDPKELLTSLLSEEIFKSCGYLMLRDSFKPQSPVIWLGHDVLARALSGPMLVK